MMEFMFKYMFTYFAVVTSVSLCPASYLKRRKDVTVLPRLAANSPSSPSAGLYALHPAPPQVLNALRRALPTS